MSEDDFKTTNFAILPFEITSILHLKNGGSFVLTMGIDCFTENGMLKHNCQAEIASIKSYQ